MRQDNYFFIPLATSPDCCVIALYDRICKEIQNQTKIWMDAEHDSVQKGIAWALKNELTERKNKLERSQEFMAMIKRKVDALLTSNN